VEPRDAMEHIVSAFPDYQTALQQFLRHVAAERNRQSPKPPPPLPNAPKRYRKLLGDFVDPLPEETSIHDEVAHLHALHQLLQMAEAEAPLYHNENGGNGIIYVGGGKYWPGIAVGCKLIRELGCSWPIEVWYRGTCEDIEAADVRGCDVTFIDADKVARELGDSRIRQGDMRTGGWEAKLYALLHTSFDRVIALDADAYPVVLPGKIIEELNHAPFCFWSDLPELTEENVKWPKVWPSGSNGVSPVQGGQFVVDRRKSWKLLTLCYWMCQHSDFYFPRMFGDQDCWRVLLASGSFSFKEVGPAHWDGNVFICNRSTGTPAIIHRCKGKLLDPRDFEEDRIGQSVPCWNLPYERRVFELFTEVMHKRRLASREAFLNIYRVKYWDGTPAKDMDADRERYVGIINGLAKEHGWASCVDIGCGDGKIASLLEFQAYVGVDVVPLSNKCTLVKDAYADLESLPPADVLLCKDVLHHWPTTMVVDWVGRLKALLTAGRWKAAVLTFDHNQAYDNQDTHLGGYRALNAAMEPLKSLGIELLQSYLWKSIFRIVS
jgi:Mannosyltransferase putative